jgi:Transglycosylase SLT domain
VRFILYTLFYSIKVTWVTLKTVVVNFYQRPFQTLLNVLFLLILLFITDTASKLEDNIILSQIPNSTVNKIVDASHFTRGYNAEKVDQKDSRELLNVGAPRWSQQASIRAVLFNARKADLSIEHQAVLLSIAEIESGFNPMARTPTTSACGLFQFVKATGERYGLTRKDCLDPWENAGAGIAHYMDNFENKLQKIALPPEGSERAFRLFELGYHLHHDGPQSKSASDKVKTVVLRGTPFLLAVYEILEAERQSKEQLTGVVEHLVINLREITEKTLLFFRKGQAESSPQSD